MTSVTPPVPILIVDDLQGLGLSDRALQNASRYARERLQSRAPGGARYPDKAADPIVVQPDVRRMLLTCRALVEGGEVIESLRDRVLGRVTAEEVIHPETRKTLVPAGEMLDEDLLDFSLKLPTDDKLRRLRLRWFFKEALRGFLPERVQLAEHRRGMQA